MSTTDTPTTWILIGAIALLILIMWAVQGCSRQETRVHIYQTGDGYTVTLRDQDNQPIKCNKCHRDAVYITVIDEIEIRFCQYHRPSLNRVPTFRQ